MKIGHQLRLKKLKRLLPKRRNVVKQIDALFSIAVRKRDKLIFGGICPFCKIRLIECVFHFVTRSKHSVRWSFSNAVGSCMACNYAMEWNSHPYVQWYLNFHGEKKYVKLVDDSKRIAKYGISDLLEIKKGLELILASYSPVYPDGTPGLPEAENNS